jgi:hypothetical protein
MKHLREDYNERIQDNANIIPADEPVFLLRGQDIFAPALILDWAKQLRLAGGDPEHARKVEDWAQKMIDWQKANPDKMLAKGRLKLPDMPKEYEVVKLISEPYEVENGLFFAIDVLALSGDIEKQMSLQCNSITEAEGIQPGYKFKR